MKKITPDPPVTDLPHPDLEAQRLKQAADRALDNLVPLHKHKNLWEPGLPAMASGQQTLKSLTVRYRWQASSHRFCVAAGLPGYWPGTSLRSFTGSCCCLFLAIAPRSLMLIASTASENAMAK
ncbi:hypothetical protein SAMN05216509_3335 [Pseudomonas sp. B10]|nr:hypothetical protein SAMN05216509_3335 [Pseudomonas sp. B10]